MPNPTINPPWAAGATYTVTNSDYLTVDVRIKEPDETPAEIFLTVPAGATVRAVRDPGSWSASGTEIRSAVAWIGAPIALGNWSLSVTAGATPTSQATVEVISAAVGAAGLLRLIIRPLANAPCVLEPGAPDGVSIDRVLAGPSIVNPHVSSPPLPVRELDPVTIAATGQHTVQVNPAPTVPLPALPAMIGSWAPEPANALAVSAFMTTNTTATFIAPAAYANTPLGFRYTAAYNLDANGTIGVSDPQYQEVLNVTVETVAHGMVLVLDKSGSMSSNLPGGSTSKWEATVQAAHAWLDLFRLFRTGENHKAAVVTFEHDTCAATKATTSDVTMRNPQNGADVAGNTMPSLVALGDVAALNLGTEQSCTPIGDALVKGLDVIQGSLVAGNKASMVLLTDGYENSGAVRLASAPTFSSTLNSAPYASAKTRLGTPPRIFTIGVGQSVDEDKLNELPNPPGSGSGVGYYRLTTNVKEILPTFADMLGQVLDAQRLSPTGGVLDPDAPSHAMYFDVGTGEQRASFLVPWPDSSHNLRVGFRPQGSAAAFTLVNDGDAAVIDYLRREGHGLMTVDLGVATATSPSAATQWRVQHLNAANTAQPLTDADVLCMVDLVTKAEITFDQPQYFTGDQIRLRCSIRSGGVRITGATIGVDSARPGEGLGTFLATRSPDFIRLGREATTPPRGPDPNQAKGHMFHTLLKLNHMDQLPVVTPPMFHLQHDPAEGDGHYVHAFADTTKEGTYTFRFRIEGTLPDGSRFSRLFVRSTWAGIRPDPSTTIVIWTTLTGLPTGQFGYVMRLTPRSVTGEYLGPFRADAIRLYPSNGVLQGGLIDNLDGSYDQHVLYQAGQDPVVNIEVNGIPVRPSGPILDGGGSCWPLWKRAILCTLRHLKRLLFGK